MQYITAKQAAEKWGITVRRVQDLCKSRSVDGAVRWGRDWMIPADAHKPGDRRVKIQQQPVQVRTQLPRKNPVIIMSNIYHTPGTADQVAESLEDRPEAVILFRAQIAFCRGQIDRAVALAEGLLSGHCGHDLQIGCGAVLAMCALGRGDVQLWHRAKNHIATAPCHNARDKNAVDFWMAAMESEIRETNTFPMWFSHGDFSLLPGDSYPSARFYYLWYLYVECHAAAVGYRGQPDSQNMMRVFPKAAEPLIAHSCKEGSLVSEAYMRLICATAYHNLGNDALATIHVDRAIALALPDKLYMLLAEYRRGLDFLLDERLALADPAALTQVRLLSRQFQEGWTVLHNERRGRRFLNQLTIREREVAKQAAFGLSNKEIAQRLNISVNTVKQSLRTAMDKTGVLHRGDLFQYL